MPIEGPPSWDFVRGMADALGMSKDRWDEASFECMLVQAGDLVLSLLSDSCRPTRTDRCFEIGSLRKHHAASGEVAYFVDDPFERNRARPDRVGSARRANGWMSFGWVEAHPLVLVPGLAGSWKLLFPLARLLARYFDVIVPGLRGDGFPWEFRQPRRAGLATSVSTLHDLALLIDHLGLECPAVLGVSFGGAIALEFAAEYPHRLGA